jgi:hypothetical protein
VLYSAVTLTLTELETVSDWANELEEDEVEEEDGGNPLSWVKTVA